MVEGELLGKIRHGFAEQLARFPEVFSVGDNEVSLTGELDQPVTAPATRSAVVGEIFRTLYEEGIISGWRDELHAVSRHWTDAPKMLVERAAISPLGVGGYAVHMNGYVRKNDGLHLWVGRRSLGKPTSPGKLDQLVAGGQPAGLGLKENLIKECGEEADIPLELAECARPVGTLSYAMDTRHGFRPDMIFVFDLELPVGFIPRNTDGEVDAFYLWPIERVIQTVKDTESFKPNCALVIIDFLVRHGYIRMQHPHYPQIIDGLRPPEIWRFIERHP